MKRALLPLLVLAAVARPASAGAPVASFHYLVTGNGFGFQVFDAGANAIKQYLERPYRYLRPNPSNPDGEGIVRRNLAFDTYFGVKVGSTAQWLAGATPSETGYVDQTNVIRSRLDVGGVETETYFVSPFGYQGNAMVMLLKVTNTSSAAKSVTAYSIHNFKLGTASNPDAPGADGESIAYDGTAATETGPGGGFMVYAPIGGADVSSCATDVYTTIANGGAPTELDSCSGTDRVNAFVHGMGSLAPGASAWWGVAVLFGPDASAAKTAWSTWENGRAPDQLLTDILAEWDAWRTPPVPGMSDTEIAVWRQAEAVLRMGQVMEPYGAGLHNHGMMLASLPPGGWHTGWVRDATYAIAALSRTGHFAEAKAALNFFLDADAGRYRSYLNNVAYRVSVVRYFGDGEEEADYSGQPTRNVEIDGWGLFLWAARTYVDASGDSAWLAESTQQGDSVYDAIKGGVADALAANLDTGGMAIADASIWEVHWGNRQHFAYTTASTARGFCDMATLAKRGGHDGDIAHYQQLSADAVTALKSSFIDSSQTLAGSIERLASGSNYRDGSTVEALSWNLVDGNDPIASGTLGAMSYLETPAGGYKRVEGSTDQYDIDEWILIDLRASDAFRRAGQSGKADQLLDWVTSQASVNYDLLPELYNTLSSGGAIGAYSGSIPMVGYGAGAYQLTMLDRAGWTEHDDCGTEDSYPDAGVPVGRDGGADGGNGADDTGRTGVACMCRTSGGGLPWGDTIVFGLMFVVIRRRRDRA